jgi:hypothetical protein
MDNKMMAIYGGLAILVIFYFVISFFSGKTWKIPHVLLAVCVFFASAVFVFMAAGTLKTHQEWRQAYLKMEADLAQQHFDNELLAKGYASDEKGNYEEQEDSIVDLKKKLGQELYDRARVWRNCKPGTFDGNTIAVTVPMPGAAGAAPPELLIPESAILYAFKEREEPDNETVPIGAKVPYTYLGEFSVTGKAANSLTLRPTLPLDSSQRAQVQNTDNTWVLYDLMPVDSYRAFADLRDPDAVDPDADFEAKIRALMPQATMGLSGPSYESLVAEYSRDHGQADETRDPANRIWKQVKFLKVPDPIKVDSDDESAQAAWRYFDATGRAVPASLRMGEFNEEKGEFEPGEIEFDISDVALLDKETADKLIEQGFCEEQKQIFVRELRDYGYDFHEIYSRFMALNDDAGRIQVDIDGLAIANTNADNHVTYRQDEQAELDADFKGLEAERDAVAEYLAELTAQWQQLRLDLSLLYRTNNALVSELANGQYNLARSINAQTNVTESTAESPQAPTPP